MNGTYIAASFRYFNERCDLVQLGHALEVLAAL